MATPSERLAPLVDALTAAGATATADPSKLRIPGVLVQVQAFDVDTLGGDPALILRVLCIAGDHDTPRTLDRLGELFEAVTDVLTPDDRATAVTVQLDTHPAPLPALQLAYTLT